MQEWGRRGLNLFIRMVMPFDRLFMGDPACSNPPLFIVGPPRSGTTLTYQVVTQQFRFGYMTRAMNYMYGFPNLAMRLSLPCIRRPAPVFVSEYGAIPGWCAPGEGGNFWFRWFPRDGEQGHYVDPSLLIADDYSSLKRYVDSLAAISRTPMVFKCVYLSMVVGILAQVFPQARFLVVRREMMPTARSILRHRLQQKDPGDWWSVKPPHYRHLHETPLWKQVAEQVFYTNDIIERDLQRYAPNRYMGIEYEELCARPRGIVAMLQEWLSDWGDVAYPDMRIPERFQVSLGVDLPDEVALKMQEHLGHLQAGAPV